MTLPICKLLDELPDPFEITLPGGISIERINLMEVIQPLLSPLGPFFNIIDTVVAVFNCLKAVVTLNPKTIGECFPDLAEAIAKLLAMHPMVALPLLIVQVIDLIIDTLYQVRTELLHLQQQMVQIMRVIDRATDLDDAGLMAIAQCAQENVNQEAANIGKALTSLGKLIGLINVFLGIIGAPEIPDLSDMAGRPLDDMVEPLDTLVTQLKAVREAIPVP
ncbi:MAG: hypothetical protein GY854_25215 [Deltaproteobacteria bacterium]|nr:hypothetical protein [Deltaproteobacteria bacterium]